MVSETYAKADEIQIKGSQIFSPVRQKWLPLTPEEREQLLASTRGLRPLMRA